MSKNALAALGVALMLGALAGCQKTETVTPPPSSKDASCWAWSTSRRGRSVPSCRRY